MQHLHFHCGRGAACSTPRNSGHTLFDGPMAQKGLALNKMLQPNSAENRAAFLRGQDHCASTG
jgi:hypothetical protein